MSLKILQYVVIRKDILPSKKTSHAFSMGACMAQACHAATAAIVKSFSTNETEQYLSALGNMTVCVLGVDDADELVALSKRLEDSNVPFHLWIEKPELIPTALATAPVNKADVSHLLSHLKLLR